MSALDEILKSRGLGSSGAKPAAAVTSKGPGTPPKTPEGSPIVYMDVVQGTSDWAALRAGIPTASQFHRIITPKGSPSKSQDKYLYELIAERLTGEPTVGYTSHWMDRGSELEAEAVGYYEFQREVETVKIGFVTNAAGTVGASPDRFVGANGALEIKVPTPANHVGYLLQDGDAYADHKIQAQGQLWVAQKDWNDLLSYCPGLPFALHRTDRDEDFIEMLAGEVGRFSERLEALWLTCLERGWAPKPKEAPPMSASDHMREALLDAARAKQEVSR